MILAVRFNCPCGHAFTFPRANPRCCHCADAPLWGQAASVEAVDLRLASSLKATDERIDALASLADVGVHLQRSIAAVEDEVRSSTWSCTMHMDTLEEALRTEMDATKRAAMGTLAGLKQESEETMAQKIIPLEESHAQLSSAMQSLCGGLEVQIATTHEDAQAANSAIQQRMEDEVSSLHAKLLSLDGAMVSIGEKQEQVEAASVAEVSVLRALLGESRAAIDESKQSVMARMDKLVSSSSRALHLLQKLMSRPDGAELFVEFDIDGDGTVSREELKLGYAKLGEDLSEDDLDAIMSLVDRDGDGEMDYNEFVQMGKMTEDVKALRMSMDENLEQLKRESEETMETKIKPLESKVTGLRDDLGGKHACSQSRVLDLSQVDSVLCFCRLLHHRGQLSLC